MWLVDVSASPDGARWFVAGGTEEQGAVLDGNAGFAPFEMPKVPLLNWVHAFSSERAFAVGRKGTILRFDGQRWEAEASPTEQDLWGIWGEREDDLWAVGGDGLAEGHATLLHFDGDSWSNVELPVLSRPRVWAFYKVWGSSADDVYVVGQSGGCLHYDGKTWSELGLGTSEDLISVWGTGPDRVAIVGGRSSGVLVTWDGQESKTTSLAPLPGLNGVWMGEDDVIHVAGIQGTLAEVDFKSAEVLRAEVDTRLVLHAIHGSGERILTVGGNLGSSVPPYLSVAFERALE